MPRVVLHRLTGSKKALDACRLVEGLYLEGQRVVVWVADDRKAKMFDEYLWTFADEAFVPHALWTGSQPIGEEPVLVCSGSLVNPHGATVLVLLDPPQELEGLAPFEEVHDFITTLPADAGRGEAWRAAGFEVREERGVKSSSRGAR